MLHCEQYVPGEITRIISVSYLSHSSFRYKEGTRAQALRRPGRIEPYCVLLSRDRPITCQQIPKAKTYTTSRTVKDK